MYASVELWRNVRMRSIGPQGSVLGPYTWNIIFDRLLQILEERFGKIFSAYVDDSTAVITGESRRALEKKVQGIVNAIHEWCTEAKLELSKTRTVIICLKYNSQQEKATSYENKRYPSDNKLSIN